MPSSLFSTYSTGENRVTASIIAVLKSLSLGRIERLIGALLEQSEFELIHFKNQVSSGAKSVPDAEIQSSCRLLVETKIRRDCVNGQQLRHHLAQLDRSAETTRLVLVLTPDEICPQAVDEIEDERLVWASFATLDQAIEELLADKREVISEREAFLLRELQTMLLQERLLGVAREVVVVPARHAWPEYQRFHAYVCQPNRTFQRVKRMAFYSGGKIHPLVPAIVDDSHDHDEVLFEQGRYKGRLGEVVDGMLAARLRSAGQAGKVILLSTPDDPQTVRLAASIPNDLKSDSGQVIAFTQNQRYVSLDRLKTARTTSELIMY